MGSVRYVFYFDHNNGITGVTLQIVHINICSSLYISYTSKKLLKKVNIGSKGKNHEFGGKAVRKFNFLLSRFICVHRVSYSGRNVFG